MSKTQHLRIGASSKNDVIIKDQGIDSVHLELFSDVDGNVFVTDLATKSGTFVNGKRLKGYTLLSIGDSLVLGESYQFNWEQYRVEINYKENNTSNKQKLDQNNQSSTSEKTPDRFSFLSIDTNQQLFLIYGLILLVIFLIAILF